MAAIRRIVVAVLAAAVVVTPVPAASAAMQTEPTPPNPVRRIRVVRDITFPLVGPARYEESFGDCRDGCAREHHGVDIFSYGWKGLPVVAAHSGIVERAEVYGRKGFCTIQIRDFDGWETRYVHLNTDTPGTDDADFPEGCTAPGVAVGSYVQAGQIIGWLGDSGNAEHHSPHLHFEMRTPKGTPVDPWRSLERSERVAYSMLDPMEPVTAAVAVSRLLYPDGFHLAFVTTIDPAAGDGVGLSWTEPMAGPVLVTAPGALDPAVRGELRRLAPDVIVVLDRGGTRSRSLTTDLAGLARAVDYVPFPQRPPASKLAIDGRSSPLLAMTAPPPFRVVVSGGGDPLPPETQRAMSELDAVIPTLRLTASGRPSRERGVAVEDGPERPGLRHAVYYPAGGSWVAFPLDGPPPEIPEHFVVLVAGDDELNASTLTFLRSLATVPATPYWR